MNRKQKSLFLFLFCDRISNIQRSKHISVFSFYFGLIKNDFPFKITRLDGYLNHCNSFDEQTHWKNVTNRFSQSTFLIRKKFKHTIIRCVFMFSMQRFNQYWDFILNYSMLAERIFDFSGFQSWKMVFNRFVKYIFMNSTISKLISFVENQFKCSKLNSIHDITYFRSIVVAFDNKFQVNVLETILL